MVLMDSVESVTKDSIKGCIMYGSGSESMRIEQTSQSCGTISQGIQAAWKIGKEMMGTVFRTGILDG